MTIGPIGAAAFITAWILFVGSMLYLLLEEMSSFALRPWAFRHGPIVLREHRSSTGHMALGGNRIQFTESGRFRFIGSDTAIFCFGRSWFGFRLRTAMPIKGTIEWRDGIAEIRGRLPVAAVLVPSLWMLCAVVWSFLAAFSPQGSWKFLLAVPAAFVLALLFGPAFLPLEKRRAVRVVDEILRLV